MTDRSLQIMQVLALRIKEVVSHSDWQKIMQVVEKTSDGFIEGKLFSVKSEQEEKGIVR